MKLTQPQIDKNGFIWLRRLYDPFLWKTNVGDLRSGTMGGIYQLKSGGNHLLSTHLLVVLRLISYHRFIPGTSAMIDARWTSL